MESSNLHRIGRNWISTGKVLPIWYQSMTIAERVGQLESRFDGLHREMGEMKTELQREC